MYSKSIKKVLLLTILLLLIISNISYGASSEERVELEEINLKEKLISTKIKMPIEHQIYLYDICQERGLDYLKTLAIIKHESSFNSQSNNGVNFGYMQIHKMHHNRLSQALKVENKPLDPYININWGTHMLSKLYKKFRKEGLTGDVLDRAVWSSYNKGEGGFRKTGEATKYIEKTYKDLSEIKKALAL